MVGLLDVDGTGGEQAGNAIGGLCVVLGEAHVLYAETRSALICFAFAGWVGIARAGAAMATKPSRALTIRTDPHETLMVCLLAAATLPLQLGWNFSISDGHTK